MEVGFEGGGPGLFQVKDMGINQDGLAHLLYMTSRMIRRWLLIETVLLQNDPELPVSNGADSFNPNGTAGEYLLDLRNNR